MLNKEKSLPDRRAGALGTVKYEIAFIVEENGTADAVLKLLKENGAKPLKISDCGARAFSYPIRKLTRGRYFCVVFEIAPEDLAKLEKPLKLNKSIIRYIIVRAIRIRPPKPVTRLQAPEPARGGYSVSGGRSDGGQGRQPSAVSKKAEKAVAKEKIVPKVEKAPVEEPLPPKEVKEGAAPEPEEERVAPQKLKEEPAKEERKPAEKPAKKEPEIKKDLLEEKLKDLVED